ncbi:hypothetical protein HYW60_01930 [Candidatus Kaiserbacteria bacterium]|nr:hypothetical protein [Candidatus Kaiserbacteria bacterium]
MSTITRTRYVLAVSVFALLVSFIIIVPSFASAEVAVQTAQLLPPGSNTCAPASVTGFTPYIYNGALHSFELTVGDSAYVAIAATVGSVNIPFNQMTRMGAPAGAVRIHADLPSTPIGRGLPIFVTMLSAKGSDQPVCITTIATNVTPSGELSLTAPPPSPVPAPTPVRPPVSTTAPKPKPPLAPAPSPVSKPATGTVVAKGTTTATSSVFATTQNILKDICAGAGANRLWFILLLLFAAIVAFAVFGQSQMPPAMRTQEWTAAAIVVPFLLLFGLWYFAESCRTSPWVPVIATIIALAGLAIAFWERGTKSTTGAQTVINLPPGAKK